MSKRQTDPEAHTASYSIRTGVKAADACRWTLTSTHCPDQEYVEPYLHSYIFNHNVCMDLYTALIRYAIQPVAEVTYGWGRILWGDHHEENCDNQSSTLDRTGDLQSAKEVHPLSTRRRSVRVQNKQRIFVVGCWKLLLFEINVADSNIWMLNSKALTL